MAGILLTKEPRIADRQVKKYTIMQSSRIKERRRL